MSSAVMSATLSPSVWGTPVSVQPSVGTGSASSQALDHFRFYGSWLSSVFFECCGREKRVIRRSATSKVLVVMVYVVARIGGG